MPKNGGRRARMAAADRAELQAFRQREAEEAARAKAQAESDVLHRSDWVCRGCSYLNFGRNASCRRCTQPRNCASRHVRGNYNASAVVPPSFRVASVQGQDKFRGAMPGNGQARGAAGARNQSSLAGTSLVGGARNKAQANRVDCPAQPSAQASRRQPGLCYADALRSPPREVEQAQQRERAVGRGAQPGVTDESEEMGARPAVLAEGPKFHEIGAEDSVVDELDEAHGDADPEPLTAKNLASRIRNLEAKKEKRENKVLKQKQAIDEQYEFIEEQNRKLNTLVFELADTREDIAAIDAQIREASRMHSELNAASGAHDHDEEGVEHTISAIVQQAMAAMRVNGRLHASTLQKFVSSFMSEAELEHASTSQGEEEPEDDRAKRPRLPSRSPAPRTPPLAGTAKAETISAQTANSVQVPAPPRASEACVRGTPGGVIGHNPALGADAHSSSEQVPCHQMVPVPGSPQREPTLQMQRQAKAALLSDEMWEDEVVNARVDEVVTGAMVAVSAGKSPELPQGSTAPPRRHGALAICDRASSEPRGRRWAEDTQSPARSRDRKDLYKELNERVELQKLATTRGRQR